MATVTEGTWDVAPKLPTGVAIAALFAASIGLLILGTVNVYSNIDASFKAWITLNTGIGPYSGKELFLLGGWLGSWVILHVVLRRRELNVRRWFGVFLGLMLIATLLVWPPIFEGIANAITGA